MLGHKKADEVTNWYPIAAYVMFATVFESRNAVTQSYEWDDALKCRQYEMNVCWQDFPQDYYRLWVLWDALKERILTSLGGSELTRDQESSSPEEGGQLWQREKFKLTSNPQNTIVCQSNVWHLNPNQRESRFEGLENPGNIRLILATY